MGEVKLEGWGLPFAKFRKAHDHENMLLGPLLGPRSGCVQVRASEASFLSKSNIFWHPLSHATQETLNLPA